jgi:lysozyme
VLVVCASCKGEPSRTASANTRPAAGAPNAPAAGAPNTPAAGAPNAPTPGDYHMSPEGLARIRGSEAFVPRVYDDGVGNQTIGYGHMLRPGESFPRPITQAEALALQAKDVARIVDPALKRISVALTQNQIDALGSFIYNVGPGNFFRSVLPNLNRGDHPGVLSHMFQYIKGRNQRTGERITLRGLLRRRREEVALYKAGAGLSFHFPGQEWSRTARRLLANGMQLLRVDSVCVFALCRKSRSPS